MLLPAALVGLLAAASCRNATLVRVPGRLLLAEQSDASADSLRLRSIPCAPDAPHCAFDDGRPGALLGVRGGRPSARALRCECHSASFRAIVIVLMHQL